MVLQFLVRYFIHYPVHLRGRADEPALRDIDRTADPFEGHAAPEAGFGIICGLSLPVTSGALCSRLVVFCPEEPFHAGRNRDFTAFVVDSGIIGIVPDDDFPLVGDADRVSAQVVVLRQQGTVPAGDPVESEVLPPGGLPLTAVESPAAEIFVDAFHHRPAYLDRQYPILDPYQFGNLFSDNLFYVR